VTIKDEVGKSPGTLQQETELILLEPKRKKQPVSEKRQGGIEKLKRPKYSNGAKPRTPHIRKPAGMSLEEWQVALRREFGAVQDFTMKNVGSEPIFSDFIIENPETGGRYKVAVRSGEMGSNYCSCSDFSTNTLGTCKHIEFALARLRKRRGAKKAFEEGCKSLHSSVTLRYGMSREVVFKAGTECPAELRAIAKDYFDKNGVLRSNKFSLFDEFLKRASKIEHELRCYEDAIQHIARVRDQVKLRETVDAEFTKDDDGADLKGALKVSLYPYQREGALFAARAGRSIIADEMGLGKTVQAIAACEMLARLVGIERVLVVCPASLKHQWKGEIERFVGRPATVVEGMLASRQRLYQTDSFYKIVNYDVIFRDRESIRQWSPDLIILDEAQRIKNWKTRLAQSVKKLESPYAIVLTGTPLENRLEELHSIVEFVDRFHLGPRFRFLDQHQVTDDAGMVVGYKELGKIGRTLSSILLRRSKREVLKELPERLEKNFFVEMTREQMKHHEENKEIVTRIVARWRRFKFLSETDQRILTMALQNMRMSCNSTYLLDKHTDHGNKCDELVALLHDMFEDPEAKAVVFSQWLGTHELIARRLEEAGWGYAFLHGGVPSSKRKDLVTRFRDDPRCRLFLSTEAGGVGMNLQCASAVINMDLPWNPAVLEQRIGRVHRLGQRRPVRVVNFIASGAIEHGMLSLLNFKKSLFAGVLDGGQDEVFLGGSRLKRFMESVEKAAVSIPQVALSEPEPSATAAMMEDVVTAVEPEAVEISEAPAGARATQDPLAELVSAGLSFLDKLGEVLGAGPRPVEDSEVRPRSDTAPKVQTAPRVASPLDIVQTFIRTDDAGRSYLKLPAPNPDTLRKLADVLYKLSGR
jgi:superfamily II DNA or RNA helicase